jgi:GxxExxY protein
MAELIYPDESYAIMGACFEVYKQKGPGFLEAVYQECLEIELRLRGIPFVHKPRIILDYKGHRLESWYEPDVLCYAKIVVELKSIKGLCDEHRAITWPCSLTSATIPNSSGNGSSADTANS